MNHSPDLTIVDRPHAWPVDDVIARLGADPRLGLEDEEAAQRLRAHGRNLLSEDAGPGRVRLFLRQFRDVLIWVLLVAAVVSGALLEEWIDAGVIMAIVVLNAALGFVQEVRAENALARLAEMAAPDAVVVRGGAEQTIPTEEIVPGDLLVLEAGDKVPADSRVIEAVHLAAEESALTGESFSTRKGADPVAGDGPLGDRSSMVFAGTAIATGRGRAVVVATGSDTEVGRIAGMLGREEPATPLQRELDRVGRRLAVLAAAAAGMVFLAGFVRGNPAEAMFLTAVALAVAAIPEGLPAVVTITLAGGVERMAERNVIVRRLPAVEALGSASVVCTDKTGTLTENEIRVQQVVLAEGRVSPKRLNLDSARTRRFVEVAALCNDARLAEDEAFGDPTEVALLLAVVDAGAGVIEIRESKPRTDEVPFDSSRKRMSTVHRIGDRWLVAVKGAPEVILERATAIEGPARVEVLDDDRRRAAAEIAEDLARKGWRTLALAYREVESLPADIEAVETDLTLIGIAGMSDAVRPEAAPAVAEAKQAGITVVMVTGDHEVTARAVAGEVGILEEGGVMPGATLRALDVDQLAEQVAGIRVYSRIDPLDKVKIVDAWRARGRIVAMTGDGVNDAPALRAADIGVAMGSGTDVAREASSMVLADDNFASIVAAVREGRSIFDNLKTVVYYLLSCNASEVLVMLVGFLAFGYLGDPLLATQLLWINLVTDGLPALALGVDPPAPGIMDRPPQSDREILHGSRLLRLARHGAVLGTAALGALVVGWYVLGWEWDVVRTGIFTTLVTVQLAHSYSVRRVPGVSPRRNLLLAWSVLGSLVLQLAVVYVPIGQSLFRTEALPWTAWPMVATLTAASFFTVLLWERLSGRRPARAR